MGHMRTHVLVLGFVLGSLGALGCGENPVPARPTYSRDIAPLMTAHCVRCHGAGGTLNLDPDSTQYDAMDKRATYEKAPNNGYLTQLADTAPGKLGLMSYATTARPLMDAALPYMPPPPAPPLTDYEHETLIRWLNDPLP